MVNICIDYDKARSSIHNCRELISGISSGSLKKCSTELAGMDYIKGEAISGIVNQLNKDNHLSSALSSTLGQFVDSLETAIKNVKIIDKNMGNKIKQKRMYA